jgi:hypothetical protein
MSGLGWIHFSENSRKQALKIVELLGESSTLDELGIGVIRNALSNEMFNGITTPMTRAKYYFLTPYLIIDYILG